MHLLPEVIVATHTVRLDVARIVNDLTGIGYHRDELDLPAVLAFVDTWVREDLPASGDITFTDQDGQPLTLSEPLCP